MESVIIVQMIRRAYLEVIRICASEKVHADSDKFFVAVCADEVARKIKRTRASHRVKSTVRALIDATSSIHGESCHDWAKRCNKAIVSARSI